MPDRIESPAQRIWTGTRELVARHLFLAEDQADYSVIDETIRNNVKMRGSALWILMFAILVASVGLNINSTAVIIGAMLISPLMGPIMGVGYGVAINDFALIKEALRSLGFAVLISLVTSTVYFWLSPLSEAQSELLARTSPTIWDVLIALFGGLAGIVGITRKQHGNVVPGVAIATALMPPLCTAGYSIATGNLYFFVGAFYLFFINSVFIAASAIVIVTIINPPHRQFIDPALEAKVKRYVAALVVVTVLPSIYLAVQLVRAEVFKTNAAAFVRNEMKFKDVYAVERRFEPSTRQIELTLMGTPLKENQVTELRDRLPNYNLSGASLVLHQASERGVDVSSLRSDLMKELYRDNISTLKDKDRHIQDLEQKLLAAQADREQLHQIADELQAQYPNIGTVALGTAIEWGPDGTAGAQVLLVRIEDGRRLNVADRRRITDWLKVRAKAENVEIVGG